MEKLTMTVEEAGKVLGISRPTAYKLVQRADFPVVRVGHRLLVSTEGLREWVKKEARPAAEKRVKAGLVLAELGEERGRGD